MDHKAPHIAETRRKYNNFIEKSNLTDEAKQRTREVANELHLLALIYTTTTEERQAQIDAEIQKVIKALDEKMNSQGWVGYFFSKSN